MKLEDKLGAYLITSVVLILGSIILLIAPMAHKVGIGWAITIKLTAMALFYIGARVYNKHFNN
jgi:hypothetical protein